MTQQMNFFHSLNCALTICCAAMSTSWCDGISQVAQSSVTSSLLFPPKA
jgi:hypothetical protein